MRVLIVGSGQLGTRHIQAVASLAEVSEIHILDPDPASLELSERRVAEMDDANPTIVFGRHTSLETVPREVDLAVVATQAAGRGALVRQVADAVACRDWLLEKIVERSVPAYERLLHLAEDRGLRMWVNCKTREYGVHRYIKSQLDPDAPIVFSDQGGAHGLANNGVHSADLFVFYDGCDEIFPVGARIDDELMPSKRGAEVFDLAGSLYGTTAKGSDFQLSFVRGAAPDHISIVAPDRRFIVEHFQKWAHESREEWGWEWRSIAIDENWAVSFMTKAFAHDILTSGQCGLPSLADAFPAHRYILTELKPHFERLLGRALDECPVT